MLCPHCRKVLPSIVCAQCQAEIPEESAFCLRCGQPVAAPEAESGDPDPFADRVLCSDGTCIGVIGPDGRCKECGKPYEPESPA
ncbi:MAG: zinc ribbon domain-containing protein [bacterium]